MNPSPVPTPNDGHAAFPLSRRLDLPAQGGTAAPTAPTAPIAPAAPLRQHAPHALHQGERVWQETNCYVDLWIELLHGFGLDPRAAFGFTVTQDFEGDQFTFFKFPLEDLERLYGTQVQELAIYDSLETRVHAQTLRGHTVLVEVDGYYLPNTRATSYRREHPKTTIGIDFIDPAARRLGYFHNTGYTCSTAKTTTAYFASCHSSRSNPICCFRMSNSPSRFAPRWKAPPSSKHRRNCCAPIWRGGR
jgi:hypothetical protein